MTQTQFLNYILPMQPSLQLVAERILGSADEAEDMVQETVVELWEHRNQLGQVANPKAYTMQALKNRCISALRKRKPTIDLSRVGDISDEDIQSEVALTEQRANQLDHMLQQLPKAQREAVEMRYIHHLSHTEMQQRLGMSSSNVYTTLSRAVSALKAMTKHTSL